MRQANPGKKAKKRTALLLLLGFRVTRYLQQMIKNSGKEWSERLTNTNARLFRARSIPHKCSEQPSLFILTALYGVNNANM
jgi:hypothetical protein